MFAIGFAVVLSLLGCAAPAPPPDARCYPGSVSLYQRLDDIRADRPDIQWVLIKDREGFMRRYNAAAPASNFRPTEIIGYFHVPGSDLVVVSFVQSGCIVFNSVQTLATVMKFSEGI